MYSLGVMVRRWGLKLLSTCTLLAIAALLLIQLLLAINNMPNKSDQLELTSDPFKLQHKLRDVEKLGVHENELEFPGQNRPVTVNSSEFEQDHLPRKRDDDEIKQHGSSEGYGKRRERNVHDPLMLELSQERLDEITSPWALNRLPLRVKVSCSVIEGGGHSILEGGVWTVCLNTSLLIKDLDAISGYGAHLKLFIVESILSELEREKVNQLLLSRSEKIVIEEEDFYRLVKVVVTDLLSVHQSLLYNSSTQGDHHVALHDNADQNDYHHPKVPKLPFLIANENELLPHPVFAKQNNKHVKSQKLKSSNVNHVSRVMKIVSTMNSSALQGFRIEGDRSLSERGFPVDYSFNSSELVQRRRFISAALDRANERQRDMASVTLSTNLLTRGKVSGSYY